MDELIKKLRYAKDAVLVLIKSENALIDFHSISYWASEVERLRIEIKKLL